jgi:hypothetical protein
MDQHPDIWTAEGVKGGLIRFYREIAGVGLVFPRADRPIGLIAGPGWGPGSFLDRTVRPVPIGFKILRRIKGLEFVLEAVAALGSTTELANHLFRECWAEGTDSDVDLCRAFGWEMEAHKFKVADAAGLVAIWHNGRITVDRGPEEVSGAAHARSVAGVVHSDPILTASAPPGFRTIWPFAPETFPTFPTFPVGQSSVAL